MNNIRLMEEIRETLEGLRAGGLIDERKMRRFEELYREERIPQFTGETIQALRERLRVSQSALAILLNISPNTVRAWEAGRKKPGGQSCLLLDLLSRKGIEALL